MTTLKRSAAHHTTPFEGVTALASVRYQGKRYILVPSGSKPTPHYVEVSNRGEVLCCDDACQDWVYRGRERAEPCRHMKLAASLLSGEHDRHHERILNILMGIASSQKWWRNTLVFTNADGAHTAQHYINEAQHILREEGWL